MSQLTASNQSNFTSPTKILMVCLGNICRSPLAEGILRHKILISGINAVVDSAGTAAYHVGEPPHKSSIKVAKEHHIDISSQRARHFNIRDFNDFDIIFVMDASNYKDVSSMATSDEQRRKIRFLLNEVNPNSDEDVPDPSYGGYDGYQHVFKLVDNACTKVIENIADYNAGH